MNNCIYCDQPSTHTIKGYVQKFLCTEHAKDKYNAIKDFTCENCDKTPYFKPEFPNGHAKWCNIHKQKGSKFVRPTSINRNIPFVNNYFISDDYRFDSSLCVVKYQPLGILYNEYFKWRRSARNVWFTALHHKKTHLKMLVDKDLYYNDFIQYPIGEKIPYFLHQAFVSRSHRYDESDRVKAKLMGFILINLHAKDHLYPFDNDWRTFIDNQFVCSNASNDNNMRYNIAITAGIKWANWLKTIHGLNIPLEDDVLNFCLKPLLTDATLVNKSPKLLLIKEGYNDDYYWICEFTYFDLTTREFRIIEQELYYYSLETIGFPVQYEITKKFIKACIYFKNSDDHSVVFYTTVKLNNYDCSLFNNVNHFTMD